MQGVSWNVGELELVTIIAALLPESHLARFVVHIHYYDVCFRELESLNRAPFTFTALLN